MTTYEDCWSCGKYRICEGHLCEFCNRGPLAPEVIERLEKNDNTRDN